MSQSNEMARRIVISCPEMGEQPHLPPRAGEVVR